MNIKHAMVIKGLYLMNRLIMEEIYKMVKHRLIIRILAILCIVTIFMSSASIAWATQTAQESIIQNRVTQQSVQDDTVRKEEILQTEPEDTVQKETEKQSEQEDMAQRVTEKQVGQGDTVQKETEKQTEPEDTAQKETEKQADHDDTAIIEAAQHTEQRDTAKDLTQQKTQDTAQSNTAKNDKQDDTVDKETVQPEQDVTADKEPDKPEQDNTADKEPARQESQEDKKDKKEEKQVYTGSIKLNKKKVSMKVGEEFQLEVTLTKENLSGDKVGFTSSDKKVVQVTKNGLLKAKNYGEATITVALGKAKATCKVTVTKEVKITISAAGDVTLSSDIKQPKEVNFFSVYDKVKDNSYFFKNVKSIFENDDLTIVNFEGTLSDRGKREDKQWAFRGKPSYIDILTEGSVEAVAFANNHAKDYGEVSYTDTIECFKKAGIAYSSYSTVGFYEVKGIKIGMISIQEYKVPKSTYMETFRKAMKAVKKEKPDLIIVSFHWGIERSNTPNKTQTELARLAIDEGANLVLGHHPHVLQPIEKYKEAYIVYSLGNFCFGGNTNPKDKDTIIYQQTFTFRNDKLVADDNVRIIPCSISSITNRNNYQPTPSEGSEKERIIKRMNNYCKPYGLKFNKDGKLSK